MTIDHLLLQTGDKLLLQTGDKLLLQTSSGATAPDAPTIGTATENGSHNGTVSITFTPGSDGGSTVTAANATGSLGDNGSSGGSSPIVVTIAAANKGVNQTWTVTQTNTVGTGSASAASNAVAATTVPGAPTAVVGTPGDTTCSITGTAPVDTGGLSITGYIGRFEGANATAAGARPRVCTSLTNDVAGTPELAAVNSLGTGAFGTGSDVTPTAGTTEATGYAADGPSTGTVGVLSTNFTVQLTPSSGEVPAPVVVTPSDAADGGTFTPTTVTFAQDTPDDSQTFKYTAASLGAKTISFTNDGGLTDPGDLTFTAGAASGSSGSCVGSSIVRGSL